MAVVSVEVKHAVDFAVSGNNLIRKRVGYRVLCSDKTDGPDVIYASASIPVVNVSSYAAPFKYGNDTDNAKLICREVSSPRKGNTQGAWYVEAEFIYDRDKHVVDRGVIVKPVTRVETEFQEFAEFIEWYKPGTATLAKTSNLVIDTDIVDADVPALTKNKIGPITNSAGTPVIPPVQRPVGKPGLIVKWSKLTKVDYDAFIGCVNNGNVTITDTYGTFSRTFAAGSLLLVAADQEPQDYWNLRVLETTLEFEIVVDNNDHYELDRGLSEYVDVGDDDGKGGAYDSTADLPPNNMRPLSGADGKPISQPIPFDGKGKAVENFVPSKARYLRWRVNPPANFASLGIGNHA